MALSDDPTISDEVLVYRRISPEWMHNDEALGCVRASTGALQTERLSVVLEDTLTALGLRPESAVDAWPTHALIAFTAGDARAVGLSVLRDPQQPNPLDEAHGLVLGKKTGSRKNALLRASRWIVPPAGACPAPAG